MARAATHLVPDLRDYLEGTRRPASAALQLAPLFLIYGLGLVLCPPGARSAVDLVSGPLLESLGPARYGATVVAAALIGVAVAVLVLKNAAAQHVALTAPVVLEGALYAALLTLGGRALMSHAAGLEVGGSALAMPWLDAGVVAAGAGLHEELLFRGLLLSGALWLLARRTAAPRWAILGIALAGSSLAFALAHHLGSEPVTFAALTYRTAAGLVLGALYLARGLGVAAWTHAAYDFGALT